MAFAISTMSQSQQARQRAAVREAEALRDAARTAASQHADALKTSGQRIEALEKRLAKDPGNLVDAPVEQRLIQAATDRVLEHLSEPGFGSLSWPPHSRPAKRLWAAG